MGLSSPYSLATDGTECSAVPIGVTSGSRAERAWPPWDFRGMAFVGEALYTRVTAASPCPLSVYQTCPGRPGTHCPPHVAPSSLFRNTLPFSGPDRSTLVDASTGKPLGYVTPGLPHPWCPFVMVMPPVPNIQAPAWSSHPTPPHPGGSTLGTGAPFPRPGREKTPPGGQMITIIRHMRYLDFFPGLS